MRDAERGVKVFGLEAAYVTFSRRNPTSHFGGATRTSCCRSRRAVMTAIRSRPARSTMVGYSETKEWRLDNGKSPLHSSNAGLAGSSVPGEEAPNCRREETTRG